LNKKFVFWFSEIDLTTSSVWSVDLYLGIKR